MPRIDERTADAAVDASGESDECVHAAALQIANTVRIALGGDVHMGSLVRAVRLAVSFARRLTHVSGATKKHIVISCVRALVEDAPGLGVFDDTLALLCASVIDEVVDVAKGGLVVRDSYDDGCSFACAKLFVTNTLARLARVRE